MGDFNARIHGRRHTEREVLGPHIYGGGIGRILRPERGYGEVSNRDMLVSLCLAGGRDGKYKVMNTWFRKPDHQKVTVAAPGVESLPERGGVWGPDRFGEIDLCLASVRWCGAVLNVRSDTAAGLASDHLPLRVTVRLRLRARAVEGAPPTRWGFKGATPEQKEAYDQEVAVAFAGLGRGSIVEHQWQRIQEAVGGALEKHIPRLPKPARRPWISTETMEMLESRRAFGALGQLTGRFKSKSQGSGGLRIGGLRIRGDIALGVVDRCSVFLFMFVDTVGLQCRASDSRLEPE